MSTRLLEIDRKQDLERKLEVIEREREFLTSVLRRARDKKFVTHWNYGAPIPQDRFFYEEYDEGKWRNIVFTSRADNRIRENLRRTWNRLQKINGKYGELKQQLTNETNRTNRIVG